MLARRSSRSIAQEAFLSGVISVQTMQMILLTVMAACTCMQLCPCSQQEPSTSPTIWCDHSATKK